MARRPPVVRRRRAHDLAHAAVGRPEFVVNTKFVKPAELPTWKTLLDPKWQGKIRRQGPGRSGAGASLIALLLLSFRRRLRARSSIRIRSRCSRATRGKPCSGSRRAPIRSLVGPEPVDVAEFQAQGYPLEYVFPTDAPTMLTGSWRLDLAGQQGAASERRQAVHQLAGRTRSAREIRRSDATPLSLRTDVKYRRVAGVGVSAKGQPLHGHVRLQVRHLAA